MALAGLAVFVLAHASCGGTPVAAGRTEADVRVVSGASSCGIASLATMLWLATGRYDLSAHDAGRPVPNETAEMSMLELERRANDMGIDLVGVRCSVRELQQFALPCIAHVDGGHFLVVDHVGLYVRVFDAPFKAAILPVEEFATRFSGHALVPLEALTEPNRRRQVWTDDYVIDVGEVPAGPQIRGSFTLHNAGPSSVLIVDTSTCCGVAVEMSGREIKPGKDETLRIACPAPGTDSLFLRTVSVLTDRPRWPVINLTVRGRTMPGPMAAPPAVDFGDVPVNGRAACHVSVRSVTLQRAEGTTFRCTAPFISARTIGHDPDSATLLVEVALDAKHLRGPVREKVFVVLASPQGCVEVGIPVMAKVVGQVDVYPHQLMFGLVQDGVVKTARARLSRISGAGFTILSVKAPSCISTRWVTEGNAHILEASLGAKIGFDVLEDFITITTDVPDDPEIRLPVYAALEPE